MTESLSAERGERATHPLQAASRTSELQPASESFVEDLLVCRADRSDKLDGQSFLHRGELRFDATRHIESRGTPFPERKVRVGKHRRDRDEEKVRAVAANDDGGTDFAAGQVRERDGQENDVIS